MATEENGFSRDESEQIRLNVLARLKRIEGQVRGIHRMVEAGKECESILIQVRAVRSALQAANNLILKRYMLQCYLDALEENEDQHQALINAVKVMTTYSEG